MLDNRNEPNHKPAHWKLMCRFLAFDKTLPNNLFQLYISNDDHQSCFNSSLHFNLKIRIFPVCLLVSVHLLSFHAVM